MKLTADYWIKYINTHTSANKAAERRMERYIAVNGTEDMDKLADYAYALVSKYGEAASALSCEMYDQMARAQNANVPEALPAETASYGEVSKAVRGAGKTSPTLISDAVGRLVKQAGADTTLQNAARDGAYFAWVAHGDTCPYCMALAAIGWQKAGKMTLKGGHAEHIHANCDCEYAIDHTGDLEIDGYDPYEINQQLLDMTDGEFDAEDLLRMSGHNGKGHDHSALNIIRRKHYAANRDYINAQKRAAYLRRSEASKYIANTRGNDILSNKIASPIESRKHPTGIPAGIAVGGDPINSRQKRILDKLPEYDSRYVFKRREVSMKDLAALTAHTNVEFAMFTKGGERLIIRGERNSVNVDPPKAAVLAKQGYRWSGHTHPGREQYLCVPSPGDRNVLAVMGHNYSVIYSSTGRKYVFAVERENDIGHKN